MHALVEGHCIGGVDGHKSSSHTQATLLELPAGIGARGPYLTTKWRKPTAGRARNKKYPDVARLDGGRYLRRH
jgi:hypothetical protein